MLADEIPMAGHPQTSVTRWFVEWAVYELARAWACYWWVVRVHVAARHGIPRSCLEDPPFAWLKVLQGPTDSDRRPLI